MPWKEWSHGLSRQGDGATDESKNLAETATISWLIRLLSQAAEVPRAPRPHQARHQREQADGRAGGGWFGQVLFLRQARPALLVSDTGNVSCVVGDLMWPVDRDTS